MASLFSLVFLVYKYNNRLLRGVKAYIIYYNHFRIFSKMLCVRTLELGKVQLKASALTLVKTKNTKQMKMPKFINTQ